MLAVFEVLERCNFIPNSMTAASRTQEVVGSFQSPPISRLYSSIADQIAHFPHKVIWQTLAPRVSAFIWQAWWGKINTFDRVQRKNPLLSLSPQACVMCFQGWESIIFSLVRLSNSIIRLQILENAINWVSLRMLCNSLPNGMQVILLKKQGILGLQHFMLLCGKWIFQGRLGLQHFMLLCGKWIFQDRERGKKELWDNLLVLLGQIFYKLEILCLTCLDSIFALSSCLKKILSLHLFPFSLIRFFLCQKKM